MSALVDHEIKAEVAAGRILIDPYDEAHVGTNSYDVSLAPELRVYDDGAYTEIEVYRDKEYRETVQALDPRKELTTRSMTIGPGGFLLRPGELYLASTIEYTESHRHLPILNGRSSIGRLGISIHVTAGTGDVGFRGTWTLEITVVRPVLVFAGMKIGQLLWFTASDPDVPYDLKKSAKYGTRDATPESSKFHREF